LQNPLNSPPYKGGDSIVKRSANDAGVVEAGRRILSLWLSLLVFIISSLSAQEASPGNNQPRETGQAADRMPKLQEHVFVPSDFIKDPFIKTYIRNSLGLASSMNYDFPAITIGNREVTGVQGGLMFTLLEFEYQHAIKEWLAVGGGVQVLGRFGTETPSLLAQGITAGYGFELHWLFKLWQNEKMMLSGSLNLWNNSFTGINLHDFIRQIIEDGGLEPDNKLVRNTPSVRGGGGLRYAYGLSDLVGLKLYFESGYGESILRRAESQWFFEFGGALSLNIKNRTDVPLGFLLGYQQNSFPLLGDGVSDDIRNIVFRISYTGTRDFSIGLEGFYQITKPEGFEESIKSTGTLISMRYYF